LLEVDSCIQNARVSISGNAEVEPDTEEYSRVSCLHCICSGDQDSVIPLTGSRTLVSRLASRLRLNTTAPYRAWFQGKQVGGWTRVFGGGALSFATVRGASHEAPFSQPERSLGLFRAFLAGRPLPESFE